MKQITFLIIILFGLNWAAQAQTHVVEVKTNLGTMKFKLYDDTPKHRDAFIKLANEGYYDKTLFYRVIQNFLIQEGPNRREMLPESVLAMAIRSIRLMTKLLGTIFIRKEPFALLGNQMK